MNTAKLSLFLPTLLLAVFIQQSTGRSTPALSTPLKALEQQYHGTEQEENGDQGQAARMFEGDILITEEQLEDHYGTPTGLDGEPAEDSHVSTSATANSQIGARRHLNAVARKLIL